ncbi:MAG: hypothetical protein CM15mV8_0150 [Caudoviricetes sp.]|nr:MAG: hypothetical protein CM15mV8_0150 [Caudoviricetes sp.]
MKTQLTGSITNDKLVNSKITIGDDTSTNFDLNLGESFEIVGNSLYQLQLQIIELNCL